MLKILFVFGVIIIPVLFCVFSFFYAVSFYTKRNSVFNSRLTAVFSIPEDEENTEMVLRELVSYIKRNEMNCFRKIYIKTNFLLDEEVFVFDWFRIHFIENDGMAWGATPLPSVHAERTAYW